MSNKISELEQFYNNILKKYSGYLEAINDIGFAKTEYESLNPDPANPNELFEAITSIIDTSKSLNQIIEQCPSSIYIADVNLTTLRMNKSFENLTGIDRETLIGRTTSSLEQDNTFIPSVCSLALKEKRRVLVQQTVNNRSFITAGTPILNENGEIFRVITNALINEDTSKMRDYLRNLDERKQKLPENEKFIAASKQMQDIIYIADLVKNTESTILIGGETGVGKSMLARYIHNTGNRKDKKMIEINCGAIPPALLESELFGYTGGAFTGANKNGKPGLIEICEGGSILLDEISELPLSLQVKLLHFLQNKKITRVGGTEEIPVNVRVIAATNKNLEALVETGEFRQDLYYRLNIVPMIIPPLRERKDDIMPAVDYFIDKYTKLYGKNLPVNQKCIDYFTNSPWKGNLRELENCIERLVVTEGLVDIDDHSLSMPAHTAVHGLEATNPAALNALEKEMILTAYEKYGSSYKVAKALGISQSTAYRKIKKYTE